MPCSPRHRNRLRRRTDPPKTRPQRPDQRIHARRLTLEEPQVYSQFLFSSGDRSRPRVLSTLPRGDTPAIHFFQKCQCPMPVTGSIGVKVPSDCSMAIAAGKSRRPAARGPARCAQEHSPRGARGTRRGADPSPAQDPLHRRGPDPVPQPRQLALHPPVPPPRILRRKAPDQRHHRLIYRWHARLSRIGPLPVARAAGWPCTYRREPRSAHYPDPGALTVTVGDTGWLSNGRVSPPLRQAQVADAGRRQWVSTSAGIFGEKNIKIEGSGTARNIFMWEELDPPSDKVGTVQ